MADQFPILFKRALAQHLQTVGLGNFRSDNSPYLAGERGIYPMGNLPTVTGSDNAIALGWLMPIPDGRANFTYRVQIYSRVEGTSTDAENLAYEIHTALDHRADIPFGFDVSWIEKFSELPVTADSSGRCATFQTFHFRGRRPLI